MLPEEAIVAQFIDDLDRVFDTDFEANPISEQRAIYDSFWARYDAPLPPEVTTRDVSIPARSGKLTARLYARDDLPRPSGLVVFFHGGGWAFGGVDSHGMITSRIATNANVGVLSVEYRLSPEAKHPDASEDCWDALTWASANALDLGFDPRRLILAGDSAGGSLAAGTALMARDRAGPAVRLQALFYPCLKAHREPHFDHASPGMAPESVDCYVRNYLRSPADAQDPYAMPLAAKSFAKMPPAIVCVAELDVLREDGELYVSRLNKEGVPAQLVVAKGLPHTFLRILHKSREAEHSFAIVCAAIKDAAEG